MKAVPLLSAIAVGLSLIGVSGLAPAQRSNFPASEQGSTRENEPLRLPNGKLQSEEILKDDHKKNLKDTQDLIELAEALKMSLEKNEQHVLSLSDIKKTEEIEKLARRIRTRMRRF